MSIETIVFLPLYTIFLLTISFWLIFKRFYDKSSINKNIIDFNDDMNSLTTIITIYIDAYQNNIFYKKDITTNQAFENYYQELSTQILNSISPELIKRLSYYITEDAIYNIIAKTVMIYLQQKVNGPSI